MTVFFVFHGGSGSSKQEYLDAISVSATETLPTNLHAANMS